MADTSRHGLSRFAKALIALVCISLAIWGIFAWRTHMQNERKALDEKTRPAEAVTAALKDANPLDSEVPLGKLRLRLSNVEFKPDLTDPSKHLYVIAKLQIGNIKDEETSYRVVCKSADGLAELHPLAVLRGVDLSKVSDINRLNDKDMSTDVQSGTILPGKTVEFTLAGDVGGDGSPYFIVCEANPKDRAVTAWRLTKQ